MPFVPGGEGFVRVTNPIAENEAYLRRELLDTLSRRAEYNLARMQGDLRLFEIGSAFEPRRGQLPNEELRVGALLMGRRQPRHFSDPKSEEFDKWTVYDEWDAKWLGETIARAAYPRANVALDSGEGAEYLWRVLIDGREHGRVRRLVLDAPVWAPAAYGVEISLGVIESADVAPRGESAHRQFERAAQPINRYVNVPITPAAEMDLALLVPESVRADEVEQLISRVSGKLLERVEMFDRYVGPGVEPGHRSLAWRLTFRHAERTLREREIEARRSEILRALADELNVRPRAG